MRKNSHFVIFTIIGVATVLVAATLITTSLIGVRLENGKWYHKETAFQFTGPDQASCMALIPSCGVYIGDKGYGVIHGKTCYVEN